MYNVTKLKAFLPSSLWCQCRHMYCYIKW